MRREDPSDSPPAPARSSGGRSSSDRRRSQTATPTNGPAQASTRPSLSARRMSRPYSCRKVTRNSCASRTSHRPLARPASLERVCQPLPRRGRESPPPSPSSDDMRLGMRPEQQAPMRSACQNTHVGAPLPAGKVDMSLDCPLDAYRATDLEVIVQVCMAVGAGVRPAAPSPRRRGTGSFFGPELRDHFPRERP